MADAQAFRRDWEANGPMVPGLDPMEAVDRLKKFQQMFEVGFEACKAGTFAVVHCSQLRRIGQLCGMVGYQSFAMLCCRIAEAAAAAATNDYLHCSRSLSGEAYTGETVEYCDDAG